MQQATLCFCMKDQEILLGLKKRAFGVLKPNGFGGKVEEGESIRAATIRELEQESCLVAREEDLQQVALIHFYFAGKPQFECHVFTLNTWEGDPAETEEMIPRWYSLDEIPYDLMWAADKAWLPLMLEGKQFTATIDYDKEGDTVLSFETKERTF